MHPTAPGFRRAPAAFPVLLVTLLVTALLAGACATGGRTDNPFEGGGAGGLEVTVINDNTQDVTVYLLSSTIRERLGRVTSHQEETFSVRWTHTREIRIELDFLAGPRCYSFPVTASPGDALELIVRPGFSRLDCR